MKHESIKKTLPRLTKLMVLILIVLILPVNITLQLYIHHQSQEESSNEVFGQLEQVIQMNAYDLEQAKKEFSKRCIQSAEMAAYSVEHYPEVTQSLDRIRELAEKLDVDELHFFTKEGEVYTGTHPEYYGYTFSSGEQMKFFLPMLEDQSLKLCQEITPNTAEGKEMQYAAVWMKDGSGIIQIGMEPKRLQQQMEEKSLEKVIATFPFDLRGYLYVVDMNTKTIVASTAKQLNGKDIREELTKKKDSEEAQKFHYTFQGRRYCVYTKPYKNYRMIRTYLSSYPIQEMVISTLMVFLYLCLAATVVLGVIIWYVDKKLAGNLILIVRDLKKIEKGNLENIMIKTGIVEFDELILYINHLLKSIRLDWSKLTNIIDKGELPVGVFVYNTFYKKSFINERLLEILGIRNGQNSSIEELAEYVKRKLGEARVISQEENSYAYDRNGEEVYLRIERMTDEQSVTYYVTDISPLWKEISLLREQSIRDSLTNLYNRRGFEESMDMLFAIPKRLKNAAMIVLDADGLKSINDVYGHSAGDEYLKTISSVVDFAAGQNKISARLGGDEFALFLYGYDSREELEDMIDRLKARRNECFSGQNGKVKGNVAFSMGVAFYSSDETDYHVLMHMADEAMYQEKRSRKSRS